MPLVSNSGCVSGGATWAGATLVANTTRAGHRRSTAKTLVEPRFNFCLHFFSLFLSLFWEEGVPPPPLTPIRTASMAIQHSVAGVSIIAAVRLRQAAVDFASVGTARVHTNLGNTDVGVDIDVFAMPVGARADFDGRP